MSFQDPVDVPGIIGSVDDSDLVLFDGASFSLYFDGSDVGLAHNGEDLDTIGLTAAGELVMSTRGSLSVSGLSGDDEDLVLFHPTSLGETTTGSFEMYLDGGDVGLASSSEDVDGMCLVDRGTTHPDVYLTTTGKFSVPGLEGADEDVFRFQPTSLGPNTSGSFGRGVFFGAGSSDVGALDLDAIWVVTDSQINSTVAAPSHALFLPIVYFGP
jgi:hypothetical protein